jgi:hypothetical protein
LLEDIDVLRDRQPFPIGVEGERHPGSVDAVLQAGGADGAHVEQGVLPLVAGVDAAIPAAVYLLDAVAVHRIDQEEGEVREEIERVVGRVGLELNELVFRRLPLEDPVQVQALRVAPLAIVDGAEPVEKALGDGALRDLSGGEPVAAEVGADEAQGHVLGEARGGLGEEVEAPLALRSVERPITVVDLGGQQRLQLPPRGGQERQVPLGAEGAAGRLDQILVDGVERDEVDGPGHVEVSQFGVIRSLEDVDARERLRDDEVQVRVPLAMRVAPQVDGQTIGEEGDVGAVVVVEPAQKILLGLAPPWCCPITTPGMMRRISAGRPVGRSSKSLCGMRISEDDETGAGASTTTGRKTGAGPGASGTGS